VQSLVHAWPCFAPLQPLLPLPFPASPLVIFCDHLIFRHSLSCPVSHFPLRFPYAFLTALCPFWHICCLDTGFERLSLVRVPFWRCRWKCLILYFLKSPIAQEAQLVTASPTESLKELVIRAQVPVHEQRLRAHPASAPRPASQVS
jgi:hypothetical protein